MTRMPSREVEYEEWGGNRCEACGWPLPGSEGDEPCGNWECSQGPEVTAKMREDRRVFFEKFYEILAITDAE